MLRKARKGGSEPAMASPRESARRFQTIHPEGKKGVAIDRAKYDAMREAILAVVPRSGDGVAFLGLAALVKPLLPESVFGKDASVTWYVTTVKLDLEARGLVRRADSGARGPQRLLRGDGRRGGSL